MFDLPLPEMAVFILVVVICFAAAVIGVLQLLSQGEKLRRSLLALVSLAVTLETVILIFRAIAIKAVPLTGLFESMIVLTIVFGLTHLFLSIAIHRVWFSSVMAWVMLLLVLMAGIVAEPASQAHAAASTPWAIAHAVAMILGGASAMLATASAVLYLFAERKLKQKNLLHVLGKVPNIEKLERMNLFGLKSCFVLMTFGLASGIGLAATSASLNMTAIDWLTDAKIVLIAIVWLLLGTIMVLWKTVKLKKKTIAHVTLVAFALILFAVVGTSVFCGTGHDFAASDVEAAEQAK
ncbi:MAG TPA: cytochrome c biogenesis protein CcsA [Sedimentisphaerales bacterium]|nr:cytochrome c biogenesis protein CcsA [Sedimentisphaerales bacterium]